MDNTPTVIPIASGKGGVGKSFLAANIGIALAQSGYRTVVIDLDLGGSILHLFLGLQNRYPGIGDFLKTDDTDLERLLVPTEISNLMFLPGDGKMPFMANITHVQKEKLISRVQMLPADYILLDLSTGTTYNTLDFFNSAHPGMIVTTPEPASVMRLLSFLKAAVLRKIDRMAARNIPVRTLLNDWYYKPIDRQFPAIDTLLDSIARIDPEAEKAIREFLGRFRPRVVFNNAEHPEEMSLATQISKNLFEKLSIEVDYFGFVYHDPNAKHAVKNRTPYLLFAEDRPEAESIVRIAERISGYYDRAVQESAERLRSQAWRDYRDKSRPG